MTQRHMNEGAPLAAIAARKRQAAERRETEAAELRREADELDAEAERRLVAS